MTTTDTPTAARIDPDGTVTFHTGDVLQLARAEFGILTDVNVCRSWFHDDRSDPSGRTRPLVGVVHDWSRTQRHPLNVKAWALYARSPICGVMWLAVDGGGPLPQPVVTALSDVRFPFMPPAPDNLRDLLLAALADAEQRGEPDVPEPGPLLTRGAT